MDQQTFQWIVAAIVMPTVGGLVTYLVSLQRAIARDRDENVETIAKAKASLETSLNMQRQDQHSFQLKVAQDYATLGVLKDVENRVVSAVSELKDDLRALERKIDGISIRQTRDDP